MIEWLRWFIGRVRWYSVAWIIVCTVGVLLFDAPAWVAVILGIWLIYKEAE